MPILRVTRQGAIGQCDCKVGGCRVCGSTCRRCKCSCDGVSPLDALNRKVGKRPKRINNNTSTSCARKRNINKDQAKCHILPNNGKMTECGSDRKRNKRKRKRLHRTCKSKHNATTTNNVDDSNTNTSKKRTKMKSNERTKMKSNERTKMKSNDVLEQTSTNNDDDESFVTANDYTTNRSDSQSLLRRSLRKNSLNEPPSTVAFGQKQLSHMKVVLKDNQINNDDTSLETTTTTKTTDDYTNHSTTSKVNTRFTNHINEEKESNSIHTESRTKTNLDIGTNTELNNSVRQIERNSIHTDLIENLVINTNDDNENTQYNNSFDGNSIHTDNITVMVPKLPSVSGLPDFIENKSKISTNSIDDYGSFVSAISDKFNIRKQQGTIHTDSMLDFFCLPEYIKKNIPSKKQRESSQKLVNFKNQRFRYLYQSVRKMLLSVVDTFVPGPSQAVFLDELFTDILSLSKKKVKHKNKPVDFKSKWEKLSSVICKIEKQSHYNSFEKRMVRAILNKGVTERDLNDLMNKHEFKFAKGRARVRAREDINTLLSGLKLQLPKRHVERVNDEIVHKIVDFILSSNNVVPNSYGIKRVKLTADEIIVLPKLQRKNQRIKIFEDYKEITSNTDQFSICRQTFYNIINNITSYEQVSLSAIDYVTSTLVNETCEVLNNIVEKVISPTDQSKASDMIHAAKYFLKHRYSSHCVKTGDTICYHGLDYALSKTNEMRQCTQCSACKFPFYVCSQLKAMCTPSVCEDDMKYDAIQVIDDTAEKFKLYMAHVSRCSCQSQALHNIESQLKKECMQTKGSKTRSIMIMDFKMKYESMSVRESSIEHYGKRGIGWHGCALIYYLYKVKLDEKNNIVCDKNGKEVYEPRKNIVYVDQILENSNKQDGLTVISLIEAVLVAIIDQLSFIDELILQSDNALTYQNPQVLFGIQLLNAKYHEDIFISEFTHSETQDGKTILDAHFASMNRHLISFMKCYKQNRITRVQTPKGLASALSFRSGVRNTMVQLVEYDCGTMDQWARQIEPTAKKAREYFSRANHIYYERFKYDTTTVTNLEDLIKFSFVLKLQSFTGIDDKVSFDVNIHENKFEPDQDAQNEITTFMNGTINILEDFDINQQSSDGSSNNKDDDKPNDDFIFEDNYRSRNSRKSRKHNDSNVVTMSESSDDDDTSDEEYSCHSASDSSDDDQQYDSEAASKHYKRMRIYGCPTNVIYHQSNLVTRIKIHQQQELGFIAPLAERRKQQQQPDLKAVRISERKDIIARAVRYAKQTITSSSYFLTETSLDPMYDFAEEYVPSEEETFKPSWARRQGHGKLYGKTYTELYMNDIKDMFERGEKESSNKMNASKMREQLVQMYPNRFSLPGEIEIKKCISAMAQKKKSTKGSNTKTRGTDNGSQWKNILEQLVRQRWKESPKVIYEAFKALIGNDPSKWPIDIPTISEEDGTLTIDMKKMKSVISYVKSKIKKEGKRSLLN